MKLQLLENGILIKSEDLLESMLVERIANRVEAEPHRNQSGRAISVVVPINGKPVEQKEPEKLSDKVAKLTTSERMVASLFTSGSTTAEIAERMGLSVRTIDYRLYSVRKKLGFRNSLEMAYKLGVEKLLERSD